MQVAAPPAGTAHFGKKMFRGEESEGHCLGCGLLVTGEEAFAEPKAENGWRALRQPVNY